jgi:hypothetical protein
VYDTADVRRVLADIWRELLPGQEASVDSDFLDSGGTSVLAVHMAALVQERLAVPVDAIDIVLQRTFGHIARHIESRLAGHLE